MAKGKCIETRVVLLGSSIDDRKDASAAFSFPMGELCRMYMRDGYRYAGFKKHIIGRLESTRFNPRPLDISAKRSPYNRATLCILSRTARFQRYHIFVPNLPRELCFSEMGSRSSRNTPSRRDHTLPTQPIMLRPPPPSEFSPEWSDWKYELPQPISTRLGYKPLHPLLSRHLRHVECILVLSTLILLTPFQLCCFSQEIPSMRG
jgi:hypothetical protein